MNTTNRTIPRWGAVLLVLVGASSYGMLSPFIKIAFGDGWSEPQITAAQMTYGTLIVWIMTALTPKRWINPFREPWLKLAAVGIFGLLLTNILYNHALTNLPASLAIVMLFQFTWMAPVMEALIIRRFPNGRQLLAMAIVWIGTFFAVGVNPREWSDINISGILYGLGSGVSYSFFLVMTGRIQTRMGAVQRSAVMLTAALPFLLVFYPPQVLWSEGATGLLGWGALLGTLGQVIPTVALNLGIPIVGGAIAAVLGSIELPVVVIGAFLLVGEIVKGGQWIGMALILAGIVVAEAKGKKPVWRASDQG